MMQFSVNGTEYKSNEKGNYFYKKVEDHWKRISRSEWDEAMTERTKNEVLVHEEPKKHITTSADILRVAMMEMEITRNLVALVMAILMWTVGILFDVLRDPMEDLIWWFVDVVVWVVQATDRLLDFLLEIKARVEPEYMRW